MTDTSCPERETATQLSTPAQRPHISVSVPSDASPPVTTLERSPPRGLETLIRQTSPVASDRLWVVVDHLHHQITVSDGKLEENVRGAADMAPVSVGWLAASIAHVRQFCGVGDPTGVAGSREWYPRCSCRSPGLAFFERSATRHWEGVHERRAINSWPSRRRALNVQGPTTMPLPRRACALPLPARRGCPKGAAARMWGTSPSVSPAGPGGKPGYRTHIWSSRGPYSGDAW
jgi:hypothetical protein